MTDVSQDLAADIRDLARMAVSLIGLIAVAVWLVRGVRAADNKGERK